MTFKFRLILWLVVGLLIPVLILAIYKDFSGFWWTLGIAVLATIVELIYKKQGTL